MAKHTELKEIQVKKKQQPPKVEVTAFTQKVSDLSDEKDGPGIKAKSIWLHDQRIQSAQRQNAVAKIAQLKGNGYIQREMRGIVQRALSNDDQTALAEQLHDAMSGWGTDEEAIFVALQKLGKDPAAIQKLKDVYKNTYKEELESEIRSEMSGEELRLALELIGIKKEPGKGEMVGTVPSTPDEYKTAARKLYGAMEGWGTDEEAVYAGLVPFSRDATKLNTLKSTYQSELSGGLTGKGLEEDIKDQMSSDELDYALYLLNAPPPGSPAAEVGVNASGMLAHSGKVRGGDVSVHTGAEFTIGGGAANTEGFSIGYKGGLAGESHMLQFIWRELIVTHPVKGVYHVDKPITTSGGTYNLTTDPDDPNYNTDSADPTTPFYEGSFVDNRTADSTTIYDQPGAMNALVHTEFAGGATKVVSRAHFNTYLIRDYKTIYHVYLQVEWEFTSPAAPPRTQTVRTAGAVESLPSDMKKRLVDEYPNFSYIQ